MQENKGNTLTYRDLRELLNKECGFGGAVELSPDEEQLLKTACMSSFTPEGMRLLRSEHALVNPVAQTAVEILNRKAMIQWSSGGHSAGAVPVYAIGVGAEQFGSISDNTEIYGVIKRVAGY